MNNSQPSILIVADSHGNNLDCNILEEAINAKVDMATAYTVDADVDARYKHKNFLKVVPERLVRKEYDTLILQGGCNEISNIDLTTNATPQIVRGWEEKVRRSRAKMFNLAENSLKNNPNLKKVIILKSLPRYDPSAVDPSSIKAKLNQFGNTLYTSMWMEKGCPKNIEIEDQNMECHGPLRLKRFGNPGLIGHDGKPWDGIHMRGRLAVRHYTNSIIRILSELAPIKIRLAQQDYHSSCPQTQYQSRHLYNHKGADNFQYQQRRGFNYRHTQTQHTGSFGENRQFNSQHYGYNVGVSNRFSHLGNY